MDILNSIKRVSNPPNPYHGIYAEWIDVPAPAELTLYEENAKSIVSKNSSPDIGFSYSVNAYRGCFHGCAYCYARPTHQYLDWGAGSDFERKIVVKINAPELLKKEFDKPSWKGEQIVFSGVTDCYQPLEASYELTRRCLAHCLEYRNPVGIITKGALIRRDIDILSELSKATNLFVFISIAFADDKVSKLIEPYAPRPSIRFRAMKQLADAGIPVGVGIAPIIPGLNDTHIPEIVHRAAEAGAQSAFITLLRLPAEVKDVFQERIVEAFPDRSKKIFNQIKAMRNGKLNQSEWGKRMRGSGKEWEAIEFLFQNSCRRHNVHYRSDPTKERIPFESTFRRPTNQLSLFGD